MICKVCGASNFNGLGWCDSCLWPDLSPKPIKKADRSKARRIWRRAYGRIPKDHEIHHIDGNPRNNELPNLICLSLRQHIKSHHGEPVVSLMNGKLRKPWLFAFCVNLWRLSLLGLESLGLLLGDHRYRSRRLIRFRTPHGSRSLLDHLLG